MYRTFVQLSEDERAFLRGLQGAWKAAGVTKRKPPLSKVLRAVINDYERILRDRGDPDFVKALDQTNRPKFTS